MEIGSLKEVLLSNAKNIYLFDCRVAGEDPQTMNAYRDVLGCFIHFTGNVLVKELTPDHVRLFIANLADGPSEGEEHIHAGIDHYTVIYDWIRWLYAQKFLTRRSNSLSTPPRHQARRCSFWEMYIPAPVHFVLPVREGEMSLIPATTYLQQWTGECASCIA